HHVRGIHRPTAGTAGKGRHPMTAAPQLASPCAGCTSGWAGIGGWSGGVTCYHDCARLRQFHAAGCQPDRLVTWADVPAILQAAARYPWLSYGPTAWPAWANLVAQARALLAEQDTALRCAEQALGC
ncbi:MAG: hypothetical protein KKA73_11875, partial [Chloroflexi bacterium]|nr:hypothetical protein [Chloroflexota bacterium]